MSGFGRMGVRSLLFTLVLAGPAGAQSVDMSPIGDGSALGIRINNPNASSVQVQLRPQGAEGLTTTVERVQSGLLAVQCIEGSSGARPALELSVDGKTRPVETFSVAFEKGPPALWISSARRGRAALAKLVKAAGGPKQLILRRPDAVPTSFSSLRFAPLIIVELRDWSRLKPIQQNSILDAVGAGSHLLISTGEGGVVGASLAEIVDVTIEPGRAPEENLTRYVPRASSRRALKPGDKAYTILLDSVGPLITAIPFGLGQIRVLGLSLRELDWGAVAQSAFTAGGDSLRALNDWLDQSVPLDVGGPMAIGPHVWGALGLLLFGLYILRRRWVLSMSLCGCWAIGAAWIPPNLDSTQLDGSRALAVSAGNRTLVIGSVRLSQTTGGPRVLDAGQWPVSIEASRGGGTCIMSGGERQAWVFTGLPGQRRRITYLMWVDQKVSGLERIDQLPKMAPAPWSQGILRRVSKEVPIPLELSGPRGVTLLAFADMPRPPLPLDLATESAALKEKARKRRRMRKSRR